MKKSIYILLICIFIIGFLGGAAFAASPSDGQYDISNVLTGINVDYIYLLVLDSFGLCSQDGDVTADNAAERCEGNGLRGGDFLFLVIVPFALAFLIFYGVLDKLKIFDAKIHKWMALFLSFFMLYMGVMRYIFVGLMSILTTTTVIFLYLGLFALMAAWGYRHLFIEARTHKTMADIHLHNVGEAKETMTNLDTNISRVQGEISALKTERTNLLISKGYSGDNVLGKIKEKLLLAQHNNQTNTMKQYEALMTRYNNISLQITNKENHLKLLVDHSNAHLDKANEELRESFKHV